VKRAVTTAATPHDLNSNSHATHRRAHEHDATPKRDVTPKQGMLFSKTRYGRLRNQPCKNQRNFLAGRELSPPARVPKGWREGDQANGGEFLRR